MRGSRRNRPGLIGTAARTAVVVGTATAVHGAVSGGGRQAPPPQTVVVQQPEPMPAQVSAAAPVAPSTSDVVEQLQKLAELKQAGVLSDDEFEDLKAKILAG